MFFDHFVLNKIYLLFKTIITIFVDFIVKCHIKKMQPKTTDSHPKLENNRNKSV